MAGLLATIVAACLIRTVHAADPDRALSQYIRDRWDSSSGFPGGQIYAITQTRDGYLWIAAENGLVRFDGLRYRLFHAAEPTSRTDFAVLNLAADPDGGLWAWLRRSALLRFRNGAFAEAIKQEGRPIPRIAVVSPGNDGAILIAERSLGLMVAQGDRLDAIVPAAAMPRSFVTSMAQTPNGDIWLGTRDSGLVRVQRGEVTTVPGALVDQKINCLAPDEQGGLWIGSDAGIFRWNADEVTQAGVPNELRRVRALAVVRDRDANVWVGTTDGLFRLDSHGVTALERRGPASTVNALFEDREANLWIGIAGGIERWRDGAFTSFSNIDPMMAASVGPIFVDAGERVWFAPASGGLCWLRHGQVGTIPALRDDVIYSIAGDRDSIWVGRQRGGLTRVRVLDDRFTTETFMQRDGLAQNQVFAVHLARDGAVWAGSLSRGASRLKDGRFTTYTAADGLASDTIAAILETVDGAIWFATPNGVSVKSAGGWRRYSSADGLPSNDVNTLFEDSQHNVWVGTAAGLAVVGDGGVQPARNVPAPLRASIVGIVEDRAGSLWIAAADHVLRVDRERFLHSTLGGDSAREFSASDGLRSIEPVKRHRSLIADSRGRIWLSTNGGLAMADARRLAQHDAPALVQVEDVSADGNPVDVARNVSIEPGPRRITLGFTGLSLAVPERVRFRYRLDGFDRDWSEPGSSRQAVYTNLGPGTYRFRVIASNGDGMWNSAEAGLPFTIAPALWQTRWFQMAMLLLFTSGAWATYRLRVRQVAREFDVRFEERLAERTRIARELHDTLLQSFQAVLLQFQAARHLIPDRPADAQRTLETGIEQARRAITEGRDAVQGLRASAVLTGDLAQSIGALGEALAADARNGNRPDFGMRIEGRPRPLAPLLRDEVYRIASEALHNAFRHARAVRIEVELRYDPRWFRLRVRDDGKGIDPAVLDGGRAGHYGLAGMHERATLLGGALALWSELDSGTEAELTVPAAVAYVKAKAS